ncbi:MAG: tetratricopeptide repeat protein [Dysgonamonadaceae bacterium]|jgi:tetratricopeptide (TPR) repeat protein|nr:tetratricopeptide repeat protein [Dysgonamonadaceae bacterium]
MKKILFTTVLCLIASITFAQKRALRDVNFELKSATPNITEARAQIKNALTNPETDKLAETWYLAGAVENRVFEQERDKYSTQELTDAKPNEAAMYPALAAVYPYFLKAIEYDRLPNEKGQVKPKYIKNIKTILWNNRPHYSYAGGYYYNLKKYKEAYENFRTYGDIAKLDIYDEKDRKKWELVDSIEAQIRFNAAMMAQAADLHLEATELLEEIKDKGYNEEEVYRSLLAEYQSRQDIANFEKTVLEGFKKYPNVDFIMLNKIQIDLDKGNTDEAISNINSAIALNPNNAELYKVLGIVYEKAENTDLAVANLKKALEFDPNSEDYNAILGRIFFNLGIKTRTEADNNKDDAQKALLQKSKDYQKEALPFFRKVYEQNSEHKQAVYALFSIYYNLDMGKELDEIEPAYNKFYKTEN